MAVTVYTHTVYSCPIQSGAFGGKFDPSTNPLGYIAHDECTAGEGGRSPQEQASQDGPASATRILRVSWQNRWTFQRQLLGGPLIAGSAGGPANPTYAQINSKYGISCASGDVIVFSPHRHPYFPSLYCKSVRMKPETGSPIKGGPASAWNDASAAPDVLVNWPYALLTVEYVRPMWQNAGCTGMFFSESLGGNTEFINAPSDGLYWDAGAAHPINPTEAPAAQIKKVQWNVLRRKITLAGTFMWTLQATVGCVNSDTVASVLFGNSFPIGTLLMDPPKISPDSLSDGNSAVQVELQMRAILGPNGISWNTFPDVQGTGTGALKFSAIYNAAGNQFKPYPTAAFSNFVNGVAW